MTHSFAVPEATTAFLSRSTPPDRVYYSPVTADISSDDMSAAFKKLKRGKPSKREKSTNVFYRDYADALGPVLATFYTGWLTCSVLLASFGEGNI